MEGLLSTGLPRLFFVILEKIVSDKMFRNSCRIHGDGQETNGQTENPVSTVQLKVTETIKVLTLVDFHNLIAIN